MRTRIPLLAVALMGVASIAGMAAAASLRISPIGVEIKAAQRAATVTVTNTDTQPVSVQIRLFHWSQPDGEDKLEPATDMIVSPPVATIPAGASYTVRIARPSAAPAPQELSYRLIIDEIPKPVDPNRPGQGVAMVLRTSMPVFIADEGAQASLAWTVWQDAEGLHVQVTNSGHRHARIAGLALEGDDGQRASFGASLNGYVLAGATRRFDLPASASQPLPSFAGRSVLLTARTRDRAIGEPVVVEAR